MYFCGNCGKVYKTGKFWKDDWGGYEEVCPDCGAYPPESFWWWLIHLPRLLKIRYKRCRRRKEFLKLKRKGK